MSLAKKQTKANAKKHKLPTPGEEPREVFSEALAITKELLNSKGLSINVDETGNIELIISSEKLESIPKDKFKGILTRNYFLSLAATEIESLVKASIYRDPLQGLKSEIPSKILDEKGTEEFLFRLDEVKQHLVPKDLEERVILKQTSQGFVLQNAAWQIITKKIDQVKGKLQDISCGCLTLTYVSPRISQAPLRLRSKEFTFEIPSVREPSRLTLELHKSDVEELIDTLTDLRENLKKTDKGK